MYVENAMAFVCLIATNVFCGNNVDLMIGKFLSCRRILITLQSLCNGHYVNRCSDIIEANKMKQILKLADNVIIRENSLWWVIIDFDYAILHQSESANLNSFPVNK